MPVRPVGEEAVLIASWTAVSNEPGCNFSASTNEPGCNFWRPKSQLDCNFLRPVKGQLDCNFLRSAAPKTHPREIPQRPVRGAPPRSQAQTVCVRACYLPAVLLQFCAWALPEARPQHWLLVAECWKTCGLHGGPQHRQLAIMPAAMKET